MGEVLKELREKSRKRKLLLAQTLGVSGADELRHVLGTAETSAEKSANRENVNYQDNEKYDYKKDSADELVYQDSSMFLKGTQSSNPHNDYCQHFVDTGQRPQNFIRDVGLADRFEEYPKLRELIKLKDELIQETATPPMYLKCDLSTYDLKEVNCKFDVILIEPPLEEYQRTMGATNMQFWSWDQIMNLDVGEVAAQRSFVFLWCGSSEGLDMGRNCLRKWGFRRCEDICWIRTNIKNPGHSKNLDPRAGVSKDQGTLSHGYQRYKENEYGSLEKPVEIFHIIEHFCLGRRRLHIFGKDSTIRPGWLTLGPELTNSNLNVDLYASYFTKNTITTGCSERIEALRPKSPPPKAKGNTGGRGRSNFQRGRGRGR
ncbi:hypothetical protein JTB14_006085 [Gonioctena quinquepunctata]|nr:hypothetical protein JTB14_006085 [Gonioctena quinquepunctata]